jgi:excisionase family DNA binding protein
MTDDTLNARAIAHRARPEDECDSSSRNRGTSEDERLLQQSGALADSLVALTGAIRDLVARSPMSSEELLTAEQLGELFRLSPRTLRDLAAAKLVPHHRIGKHYRFSRDDIAEILHTTKQVLARRQSRHRAA